MFSKIFQLGTRIRSHQCRTRAIRINIPRFLLYKRNLSYSEICMQEQTGSQNKLTTGENITNAIIEINNANNFKFLRLPMVIRKHDLFNIEQFERQQAEKQEQSRRQQRSGNENKDESYASDTSTPVRSVEKPRRKDERVTVESFLDTDSIVNDLKAGGFTNRQSEIVMNLVKESTKTKMYWVHTEMAPKVDIENNNYLFKAARNELEVEVTNSREIALMDLQNSSILLKRLINGLFDEMSTKIQLNDDTIKIELSQFKHENNLRQRNLEMKNTDLNNRIISELMSGLRSNIEQFRWELTRAGIFAIMFIAVLLLSAWRSITNKNKAQKKENEVKSTTVGRQNMSEVYNKQIAPVQERTDEYIKDPTIESVTNYTITREDGGR
ncbi:DEBR0S4_15500g1_1 [Brettanomyces bruxellensis]|uniref:DEBR0S4_15500g1_1 n=1 Tax=Dekkera bruxellensis TaxID=5007 RepID=A0A7D9H3C7_DEKBR|nr:DEBR0S4_15500g1_1 [Brettanomyces bruxellensis]